MKEWFGYLRKSELLCCKTWVASHKKKKKEVNVSYFMGFVVERDRFD